MKRNSLLKLLTIVLALCSVLCFTVGCGEEEHKHNFNQKVITETFIASDATCTTKAKYYYSCECGAKDALTFEYGDVLEHSFIDYVSDNNATCTEDGTETSTCDRVGCNEKHTRTKNNTALNHNYGTPVYTWNYDKCTATRICANDSTHKETETVTAVYIKDTDATCLSAEKGHYKATFNNSAFVMQETEENSFTKGVALDHSFDEPSYTWDNDKCTATRICSRDNSHVETETVTANYVKDTNVTCTTPEKGHYKATFVNSAFGIKETAINSEIVGEPLNHTYGTPTYNWSDNKCTATRICSNDNSHKEIETVVAIYEKDTDATCITPEKGHYIATFENSAFATQQTTENSFEYGEELGHNYGEWVSNGDNTHTQTCVNDNSHKVTKDCNGGTATCTKKAICKDCGEEYGSLKDHFYSKSYSYNETHCWQDATCGCDLKQNYKEHNVDDSGFCTICGMALKPTKGVLYDYSADGTFIEVIGYTGASKRVRIAETYDNLPVKTIYAKAFSSSAITEVIIPSSVTSIGKEAFYNCSSLTKVNYEGTIDEWAQISFSSDDSNPLYNGATLYINDVVLQTEITINAEKINDYAFYGCSSLTSVTIGDNVTSIGSSVFGRCSSLRSITIPFVGAKVGKTASDTYQYPFGYIFGTSSYTGGVSTKQYYHGSSTSSATYDYYYIPSSLKSVIITGGNILYGAFYNCAKLTSIEIPNSVTSIGSHAFYNCDKLTSIEIPESVTSIGDWAFGGCSSLTSVVIGEKVTSIGEDAFHDCKRLTEINFNAKNCADLSSNNSVFAFAGQSGSGITVTFGDNVKCIPDYLFCPDYDNSFSPKITSITIGDNVTSIGWSAFSNCSSLTSIEIPNSVTSIGSSAFNGCSSLTSVVIGEKVTSIGSRVFEGCSSLTSIEIPNSVTSIDYKEFYGCSSLTSVVIGEKVTSIGEDAFFGCSSLTSIKIPESVTSIGGSAFYKCSSLTSVEIPNSVTSIGSSAFYYCSSLVYHVEDNIKYLGNKNNPCVLLMDVINANYSSYSINEKTRIIMEDAFEGCTRLTSIVIPDSVTSIGDSAFEECTSLANVKIGNGVNKIGSEAFRHCTSISEIYIPKNVVYMGDYVFSKCIMELVISCQVSSQPDTWSKKWDYSISEYDVGSLYRRTKVWNVQNYN